MSTSDRPLAGVRVVGVEHSVAGPLCTRILCELGATVVKIERPDGGDFARHWDANAGGQSAQFLWLNRGKRSAVVDLKDADERARFDQLLADADVLVHNLAPAGASRLGLDAATLAERFPALVNCQLSGYGADGPMRDRKAYDMLIQAEAGVMSLTGTADTPTRTGVSICDVSTGLYAAILILAALRERDRSGRGRHLDLAMLDVTLEFMGPMLTSYLNAGVIYPRLPDQHHAIAPYGSFVCGDGERVMLAIEQDAEWQRFCRDVLADARLGAAAEYATNVDRLMHRDQLQVLLAERLLTFTGDGLARAMTAAGLAYGRVNDVSQVLDHPVVHHREIVRSDGSTSWPSGLGERIFAGAGGAAAAPALGEATAAVHDGFPWPNRDEV